MLRATPGAGFVAGLVLDLLQVHTGAGFVAGGPGYWPCCGCPLVLDLLQWVVGTGGCHLVLDLLWAVLGARFVAAAP